MPRFNFDKEVNRLNTKSYKWDLMGEEYLPLWVADTDFEVPPAVTARIQKRVDHGIYGYLLTGTEVYEAIQGWFKRSFDVDIPMKDWTMLVPGIVPGLAVASNIGGGKSITNVPNYVGLLEAPASAGNTLITVPMYNEEEYYTIDFLALQQAITPDTRLFYLCNPHNPVGRVYSYEELKAVSEFAKKNHLIVISDEAHCEVVYEGKHIPFFSVDDYARDHSITFYSNGKMCNVPDLILAFAIIPNPKLRKEFARLGYAFGEEHILNVEAGTACYAESDDWKEQLLTYLRENRDYLEWEIKLRFPKAEFVHLEATYLLWVDMRAYGEDVTAKFFMDNAQVFFTDGGQFGADGYIRINFGTRREILTEALDRMQEALIDRL